VVLDGLLDLYGLKYDSATACGLLLYLCSYKLNGSITAWLRLVVTQAVREQQVTVGIARLTFVGGPRGRILRTGSWLGCVQRAVTPTLSITAEFLWGSINSVWPAWAHSLGHFY